MKNRNVITGFGLLIGVVVLVSLIGFFLLKPKPLVLQGEVEVTEVRVSGKVPGRISRFLVEVGQQVRKGDSLVVLEIPEVEAKLQQAMAAVDAAQAQNSKALKGARKEQIEGAYEQWQRAEAGATVAKQTYDRVKRLFDQGVLPAQKHDEAEANYKASTALAKAAKSQYDMSLKGAEQEDKNAAQAMVHRAQGAMQEVEAYKLETCLLSPATGEVSDIFPQEGELVGSGAPVMNIAKTYDVWVTFNVREDLLGEFTMGKTFKATIPALNAREIELKVSYIKVLGSYATWKATKVSGEFDMKTFEVHAKPTQIQEDIRPGMSVLVSEKDLNK